LDLQTKATVAVLGALASALAIAAVVIPRRTSAPPRARVPEAAALRDASAGHGQVARHPTAEATARVSPESGRPLPAAHLAVSHEAQACFDPALLRDFEAGRHGIRLTFAVTSNRNAIEHVIAGRADAAWTVVAPSERERRHGVGALRLGRYVPVVVPGSDTGLNGLSRADLRRLLRGEVRSFREVGGRDATIELLLPPPGPHADHLASVLIKGDAFGTGVSTATEGERLDELERRPSGIAVVSLPMALARGLRPLPIDGAAPTSAVASGYPFAAELFAVYGREPGPAVIALLELLRSPAGRRALATRLDP